MTTWGENSAYCEQIDKLTAERDAWRDMTVRLMTFMEHAPVESGVCCCGENMVNHSDPMWCGHTPVDQWAYSVAQWRATVDAAKGDVDE